MPTGEQAQKPRTASPEGAINLGGAMPTWPSSTPPAPAPKPATQEPKKASQPLAGVGPIDIGVAPDMIDGADTQEACVAWFFRQMRTRYTTGVMLLQNGGALSVWKWESRLKVTGNLPMITFEAPSLFRVVARTLRPYHGFPVENPIHKEFFRAFGYGKMPAHVTAVPILVNSVFKGVFLCISNDAAMSVDVLDFVEMISDRTVTRLEKTQSPFGAASSAA